MRFVVLLFAIILSGCANAEPVPESKRTYGNSFEAASQRCLEKYSQGSFDYYTCYRISPEVEAYERKGRLANLGIISKNKSPYAGRKASRPVQ